MTQINTRLGATSITLKMAEVSWSCRPLQMMLRWAEKLHDELFQQGDVDKLLDPHGAAGQSILA